MAIRRTSNQRRSPRHGRGHGSIANRRLRFEPLEDRRLLSITVDTLVDENDGVGVGTGTSLREAIAAAAPGDTINFAVTGTINLSIGATNSTKQLSIDKSLTIQGPGAGLLTIKAFDPTPTQKNGDGSRVFTIDDGNAAALSNVSISGLAIAGGDINTAGGAIFTKENLTLANSVVSGNTTTQSSRTAGGAGIYSSAGSTVPNTLSIFGCTFTGNTATTSEGGAVRKRYGSLLIDSSLISRNYATYAGGVSAADGNIIAQIQNCTITQNKATGPLSTLGGGGIVCVNGQLTVSASIISNNSANAGAGIFASKVTTLSVQNSNISGNTSLFRGGGIYANTVTLLTVTDSLFDRNSGSRGGGIASTATTMTLTRTTISANRANGNYCRVCSLGHQSASLTNFFRHRPQFLRAGQISTVQTYRNSV
jgi:predicted outer membrane repeat protein